MNDGDDHPCTHPISKSIIAILTIFVLFRKKLSSPQFYYRLNKWRIIHDCIFKLLINLWAGDELNGHEWICSLDKAYWRPSCNCITECPVSEYKVPIAVLLLMLDFAIPNDLKSGSDWWCFAVVSQARNWICCCRRRVNVCICRHNIAWNNEYVLHTWLAHTLYVGGPID